MKPLKAKSLGILALITVLAACGGGGGEGSGDPGAGENDTDLVVVGFALVGPTGQPTGATGTENAYRNNRMQFTFSSAIVDETVSDRTIQIGVLSGSNLFLAAQGRFTVDGNVVTFDPTITPAGAPKPFGFQANSTYSVSIPALPEAKTIISRAGKPVLVAFTTTFTTTDLFLPDLDQPRASSSVPTGLSAGDVNHLLAMTPVERKEENDATQQWENLPWVSSQGDVTVSFSEAMHPDTFDPARSFRVVNLDRKGRDVLGVHRFSDDARTVTFRPTFGYGRGPFLIQVEITADLTDLAGNPISNPHRWVFLTEYDEFAVSEGVVEEFFDDNTHEDTTFSPSGTGGLARWNPATNPGMLVATFGNSSIVAPFPYSQGNSSNSFPLGSGAKRVQNWMKVSEIGNAGTITGLSWWPASNVGGGAVITNLITTIGHNSRTNGLTSTTWTTNLDVGTPVTVLNGVSYTVPTMTAGQPCKFPAFQKSFGFDGTNSLVIDNGKAALAGSTSSWRNRTDITGRRVYNNNSQTSTTATAIDAYAYTYSIDFRTESSMARSLFFRSDSDFPEFLDPIVSPTEQPAGTEVLIEYQGAHETASSLTQEPIPDPATLSGWTEDPTELVDRRYLRFRVTFRANLATGVGPMLDDILIPYLFFD